MTTEIERLVQYYEAMRADNVGELGRFYAGDVYFKDPFNEVQGLAALQSIFSHMFVTLDKPRFVVTERVEDGRQCFLTWDFEFRFKGRDQSPLQTIRGGSHLRLNDAGLVAYHRDYWDTAEELYQKLPLLGSLMRWLRRRGAAPRA